MDSDGLCDPYLVVKVGEQTMSTRSRYVKNTLEPDFYEAFEFPITMPGDAAIDVQVWDYDGIGDDHIGSTSIDIEDRWFSKNWRQLPVKPLEYRTLKSATSSKSQGKLQCWVEILDAKAAKKSPLLNIKPPPPQEFELRVVVWGVKDVPIADEFTNQNDLYVTCECVGATDGADFQKTDTHLRSKNGIGNFNWRMKFPLMLPRHRHQPWPRLRFQVWDKDLIAANDSLCETQMSLKTLCKKALKSKDPVKIRDGFSEIITIKNLKHPNAETGEAELQLSVELMRKRVAEAMPAGFGRGDPNQNPHLPKPDGRVNWRITAPLEMLKEILGPELYNKFKIWFWVCFIIFMIIQLAPFVSSALNMGKTIHDINK